MSVIVNKIYGLWAAKQTGRGAPAATAVKRLRQVTGNVKTDRSDNRERFGNDDRYGDAQHFVDTLVGSGDPGIQAQPGVLAYLLYLMAGQEVFDAEDKTHTITPASAGGFWSTFWKKVGTTDIVREMSADCMISQLVVEGSTGQKVVRVTPTLISLDPGTKFAADPVKGFDEEDAFIYTEGESAFKINDEVIRAQSQFSVTINEAYEPVYTDSVVPLELVAGEPDVTLAVTLALNTEGLKIYNREVYGTPTPAAGTKPLKTLAPTGSYGLVLTKDEDNIFDFEVPGVKWTPDVAVEPNPAGGLTEVSLAGMLKIESGEPPWRAVVTNEDAAYA